ncbi:MAG TPA: energy transducer TonB [Longimicrobiaceae bacterium]|nr:energy transducer TonB [Longimicrobiaceae bacterium]
MRRIIKLVILALAAAAGACASAGGGSGGEQRLPLSAAVDSVALVEALRRIPAPDPSWFNVFRVEFDSAGRPEPVEAVSRRLPDSYALPVANLITAHLRPQPPRRRPFAALVRVVAGPDPRLEMPDFRERPPLLINRDWLGSQMSELAQHAVEAGPTFPAGGAQVIVKMRVEEDGTVSSAAVVRSSGFPTLDLRAVEIVRQGRFRPATLDEHPVRVWVRLPLSIVVPRP